MSYAEKTSAKTSTTRAISRAAVLAIGVAVPAVGAATALATLLLPSSSSAPFGVYCLAVMVAAGFGGAWAGGIATSLSAVALDYLFLLPSNPAAALPHRFVSFAIFLGVSGTVAFLIHRIRLHGRRIRGGRQHLSRVVSSALSAAITIDGLQRIVSFNASS
jgi:K+-sensing histidine kinase KdpD